jgi:hypothetical protein
MRLPRTLTRLLGLRRIAPAAPAELSHAELFDHMPPIMDDHRDPGEIEMDDWFNAQVPDSLGG